MEVLLVLVPGVGLSQDPGGEVDNKFEPIVFENVEGGGEALHDQESGVLGLDLGDVLLVVVFDVLAQSNEFFLLEVIFETCVQKSQKLMSAFFIGNQGGNWNFIFVSQNHHMFFVFVKKVSIMVNFRIVIKGHTCKKIIAQFL